jgi:hypothetical protein
VQHAGQLDVVDVPAAAADEPRVLLAQHPAVADRVLIVALGPAVWDRHCLDRHCLDRGHA